TSDRLVAVAVPRHREAARRRRHHADPPRHDPRDALASRRDHPRRGGAGAARARRGGREGRAARRARARRGDQRDPQRRPDAGDETPSPHPRDQAGQLTHLPRRQRVAAGSRVDIRVDALYGQTTHKDIGTTPVSGNTKLYGGLASVVYNIGPKLMARPYILGGVGAYHVKIDAAGTIVSETKLAFGLGGGLSVGMGQSHFFVEGRFVSIRESGGSTSFLPVTAGVTFGK